jgi:DNA polymerase I-like protein with 3'-5' exonuclease and polymerase domains
VEDNYPVGVGLSWSSGTVYISFLELDDDVVDYLIRLLAGLNSLVAHNVYFDGSWFWDSLADHPPWLACTYGLYRQLATEGFEGQRWGLKGAMEDVLGWTDTNEEGIDTWLVGNGYIRNTKKQPAAGYYPTAPGKDGLPRWASPDKGEMWRCPPDILGAYCCADADATYLLYTRVLTPALEGFPELREYHESVFLRNVELLIEQRYLGILVDVAGMRGQIENLQMRMVEIENQIRDLPVVGEAIAKWELGRYAEFRQTEPERYKKQRAAPEEPPKYKQFRLGPEPARFTSSGKPNKNWEKWDAKRKQGPEISGKWLNWQRSYADWSRVAAAPEESATWRNWEEKHQRILAGAERAYRFNLASGDQLQYLLYEVAYDWEDGTPYVDENEPGSIYLIRDDGTRVELDRTDSGKLPTGEQALMQMGEVGRLLNEYNGCEKEIGYLESYIRLARPAPQYGAGMGTLHPGFRTPGALTGRLSGVEPNIQQIPKSRGTLEHFRARPTYVWVDCDHTSLENVVLAELSRDPMLMRLYGPGAAAHDAYLFNAAGIYKQTGVEFLQGVGEEYDVDNPTGISELKKKYKKQRDAIKKTTLSKNYGIGAEKLWRDLNLDGISLTLREVESIHSGLTDLYAGIQQYDRSLREQWRVRGGWIMNGYGRPLGVWEKKRKDLVNRDCQSTGHDIHMLYVCIVADLLNQAEVEWYPIIADFHDQIIIEVAEEQAELAVDIVGRQAYDQLNSILGGIIPLRGEAQVVRSLAEAKLDE